MFGRILFLVDPIYLRHTCFRAALSGKTLCGDGPLVYVLFPIHPCRQSHLSDETGTLGMVSFLFT